MSSTLAKYESFLINNVSTISTLESTLRSVTWFLPGRFKDAELASESVSALLNVTSLYHDTLLARIVQNDSKWKPILPVPLHTRYARAWCDKDSAYKWIARTLELLKYTQLLVEMGLRRKTSDKTRWRGIILLETIKALLRFALLRITRRPLLSPAVPERDFDPSTLPPKSTLSSPTLVTESLPSSMPSTPEHLKNNHVPLPLSPSPLLVTPPPPSRSDSSVEDYLLPKALTTSSVRPPLSLVNKLATPQDWLAEAIYILRPLIYASLLASGRFKNRALVSAFALELASRNMRRTPAPSATLEQNEYSRRDKDMLWYLLRGSVWDNYTRPKLEQFTNKTAQTPIFGLFSAIVSDWIPLIDDYYYYTAP